MIDFIYKLNSVLPSWPAGVKWSLNQISDATETSIPHVIHYLGEGLSREIDVAETLTSDEAAVAVGILSNKIRPQIDAREKQIAEARSRATDAYLRMMNKVRILLSSGNSHGAYKTITYFAGQHEADLPVDVLVTAASDAVRIGIKAKINIQELGRWLHKGVSVAMGTHSRDGLEEALDLIDAYGEFFLGEESGKGQLLLGNILAKLEEPSARYELWGQYKDLVGQLYDIG